MAFGASGNDYVFIQPPDEEGPYWKNVGAGTSHPDVHRAWPMPNRGDDSKIISWEDPVYLEEWLREIYLWTWDRNGTPTRNESFHNSNEISIDKLVKGIKFDLNHLDSSTSIFSVESLYGLLAFYKGWYALEYSGWGSDYLTYACYKKNYYDANHKVNPETYSISGISNYLIPTLYASGYIANMSSIGNHELDGKVVDITEEDSNYGIAIKNNCFIENRPIVKSDNLAPRKKVILTLYYCLQALANSIVFTWVSSSISVTRKKTSWNASASRILETEPVLPSWDVDDSDVPADLWTDENASPGQIAGYIKITDKNASNPHLLQSEHIPPTTPDVDINPTEYESSESDDYIASYVREDSDHVEWTSQQYNTEPSLSFYWVSQDSGGYWDYSTNYGSKYIVYTGQRNQSAPNDSGLDRSTNGVIEEASSYIFTINDNRYVKTHSVSTEIPSQDFLIPQMFFFWMRINCNSSFTKSRYGQSDGYPYYSSDNTSETFLSAGTYHVLVPVSPTNVELIGFEGVRSKWKLKKPADVINACLEKLSIASQINACKETPSSLNDLQTPSFTYPETEDNKEDRTDEHTGCSGSTHGNLSLNLKISVEQVTTALLWRPYPSVGVREVTDEEVS